MAPLFGETLYGPNGLRNPSAPTLFVNTVNVQTGASRVFGPGEVAIDALLASACAPLLVQAVRMDDQSDWDGSYGENPTWRPLFQRQQDVDVFIVELTPLLRAERPMSTQNFLNRVNEIASINALKAELREVADLNGARARADACLEPAQ